MTLLRILLLLAFVYAAYRLVRHLIAPRKPRAEVGDASAASHGQPLLRCDRCGTLVTPAVVVRAEQRLYCSEACRAADREG
ncbi:MAG: zinc finger MYND domain-containing protein [Magnetococcales bacterium]|nr:zinc finger MYND domain-containing protein [Magnetococcales bacterium]